LFTPQIAATASIRVLGTGETDAMPGNATPTPASHAHGNITNAGLVGTTANLPLKTGTGGIVEAGAFGTGATDFCVGNDSRLSDARTPASHAHGNITNGGLVGSTANLPLITGTAGIVEAGAFGTGATNFCAGNDARLSDTRTPTDASVTMAKLANLATAKLIGRVSAETGVPEAVTIDTDLSSVSANDDTIPSAKATKAMGDLKLPLAGGTMTGAIVNPILDYPIEPADDDTAKGPRTNDLVAGETIAQWNAVYLKSDGKWWKTDSDAEATASGLLAMALEAKNADEAIAVALPGAICRNDGWSWATLGAKLYLESDTIGDKGALTLTPPAGTGDIRRIAAYVLTDDCIFWNPEEGYIEIA
jgi:hypothetical protein